MKPLKSNAIILRRHDYAEADRIITLLSDQYGKIRVIAKGIRKAKSKLAGSMELFSISEVHHIRGRSDIGTLMTARMKTHFGNIVKDLDITNSAYAMIKAIDKSLEDDTGQEYFGILSESLAALNDSAIPEGLAEASFIMRFMQQTGTVPDFSTDSNGERLNPDSTYEFDFETVAFKTVNEGPFNKNHVKVMKLLAHNNPANLSKIKGLELYTKELLPLVRNLSRQYVY